MNKGDSSGTLVLGINRGDEIQVEYAKKEIIDKINSYFGYKLIDKIKLQTFGHNTDKKKERKLIIGHLVLNSFRQIKETFHDIIIYKNTVRFLVSRLIYNDGLVTIFAVGAIEASGTFGFTFNEIMMFGIVLNIAAGLGAFLMGFIDDIIGGKLTIQISLIGLMLAVIIAVFANSKFLFWVSGIVVGLFAGPNQSASRSLMGRLTPPTKINEFYGFFAFSGKLTSFLGPILLGLFTKYFASQRFGVAIVFIFFFINCI